VQGIGRSASIHGVESRIESPTTSIKRTYLPGMTGNSGMGLGGSSIPLSGTTAKSQ
jgi:hypothetical protein